MGKGGESWRMRLATVPMLAHAVLLHALLHMHGVRLSVCVCARASF